MGGRPVLIACACAAAAAFAAPACGHPDSLSTSRIRLDGADARHRLRCQALSLLEVIPGLDADGDGAVSGVELAARRDDVFRYVDAHHVLRLDDRVLTAEPRALSLASRAESDLDPFRAFQWIDVDRVLPGVGGPARLTVEMTLFLDTSPDHRDICIVQWPGGLTQTRVLGPGRPRVVFDPARSRVLVEFGVLGARHILSGWDHLAFLAALILASRRVRTLLGVATAFTVAHSLTLALSATRVIDLSAHQDLVEIGIALSIAYVAADTLVHPRATRGRWGEAFVFGLVHGLGFAGFLTMSLVGEAARLTALVGFNAGVEVGQVLIVVVAAPLVAVLPRRARAGVDERGNVPRFLAPVWLRRGGSLVLLGLGLWWFGLRVLG